MTVAHSAIESARRSIVKVGDGRGFIVGAGEHVRYVITAAHCLPHYPEPHLANSSSELAYPAILGLIGQKDRTVWAELVEFNAASDLAVLGPPDNQTLWEECEECEAFTSTSINIGQSPAASEPHEWIAETETPAWMLSLDGLWQKCTVQNNGRFLVVRQGSELIKSGMSGSPILNDSGAAIGLVSTSASGDQVNFNPSLSDCLPPWLLRKFDGVIEAMQPDFERAEMVRENLKPRK